MEVTAKKAGAVAVRPETDNGGFPVAGNLRVAQFVRLSMKLLPVGLLVLTLVSAGVGRAQTSGTCGAPFQASLKPGASLSIHSRSAGIEIVGTDQAVVRISCTVNHEDEARDVSLRVSGDEHVASLQVRGGPSNNLHIRIEVPRKTNLKVEMPAGEVKISQVTGDKGIELRAGDVSLSGLVAAEYRRVNASVGIGDLHAPAFNVAKDGFFRSFSTENSSGEYHLSVHVTTGSISLE